MKRHWGTQLLLCCIQQLFSSVRKFWRKGGLQYITQKLHVAWKAPTVLIWRANGIHASEIVKVQWCWFFFYFLSQTSLNILNVFPVDLGFPEKLLGKGGNWMCSGAMYRRPYEAQSQWHSYCAKNNGFSGHLRHLSKCRLSCLSFLICKYFHENRRESSFVSVHGRVTILLLLAAFWKKCSVGYLWLLVWLMF